MDKKQDPDFVEALVSDKTLPPNEKFNLFVHMVDTTALLKELKTQAFFMKTEMVPKSLLVQFAYATLRIARPELFDDKGEIL